MDTVIPDVRLGVVDDDAAVHRPPFPWSRRWASVARSADCRGRLSCHHHL